MNDSIQSGLAFGVQDQFRLTRVQLFNWGTFCNVFDFSIPADGYLIVGPSGSGKSTLLDAHAALLTPPKWVDFNVAAREAERHGKDRNLMTYIRGAWAQQTGDSGEYVSQYLRGDTTWSAISETYRNGLGRCVTLAQVLWVRGKSTAAADARRLYLVLGREFEIRELEFFPKNDFDVRRFKSELPDAHVHHEFSAYQERFRRELGIENERALRLLHKTQSAKNLGDLNTFMRDFMLDAPATFEIAERLVEEFGELNAAHQAVVAARQQIDTLRPARDEYLELEGSGRDRNGLQALLAAVDHYREHRRRILLGERRAVLQVELEGVRQETRLLMDATDREFRKLNELQRQKLGMDAGIVEQLQQELRVSEEEKPERIRRRSQAESACRAMGWVMPETTAGFVERVEAARAQVLKVHEYQEQSERHKDGVKEQLRVAEQEFASTMSEVRALERKRSNLDEALQTLRERMAADLGLAEEKLPFVGELLEVKAEESAWQGAIERVLGGFARSLLVDDRNYAAVSAYINERHFGRRLAYFRVLPQAPVGRTPGPSSLARKLSIAPGPYADWLREEIKTHFDFECAGTLQAFRAAPRAVTLEGQVKHSATRHEKNDRERIDDRSRWVLGFDNQAKLALYRDKAGELGSQVAGLRAALARLREDEANQQTAMLHCQTLANFSWNDVDVGSLLARIADLHKRLSAELAVRPELARVDELIQTQADRHREAAERHQAEEIRGGGIARDIGRLEEKLSEIIRLWPQTAQEPAFREALDQRFSGTGRALTLENIDEATRVVERRINEEVRALDSRMAELRNSITRRFADFNRSWPAEAGGLDPVMESSEDYFAKLRRLETDGLPRFEERFLALLREQSDQNLTLLSTKLDQERTDIKGRMELVNESLLGAPFNPGTHLVIETGDRRLEEVRQFRADLKGALSHSFSSEPQLAEQRFVALAALVKRLASHETADRNWRALVLDVRLHVEFVAREIDEDGIEVEVYRSGAGKSGGQRQKLAATCLAAALRYQLGGQDRAIPGFSTVMLDEAFDKADAEFTAMAMNIFRTFGFQMVVATPLKSVMTLEPFIGGACFVHIRDRKMSAVIPIDYDGEARRLKLSPHELHGEETAAP